MIGPLRGASKPSIVFINTNGSGMGHLSTCLAYANRLRNRARCTFFTLTSAVEAIHGLGFEADYLVSSFWSRARGRDWNRQLVQRFGLMLERVRPDAVVFDGTWPFQGMLDAVAAYGERYARPKLVWSNLAHYKPGTAKIPIDEALFDLILRIGEVGTALSVERTAAPGRTVVVPPVTILRDDELLDRHEARAAVGLDPDCRYALLSLGPGNRKDVSAIGRGLIDEMRKRGIAVVWAEAPISVRDMPIPDDVMPLRIFPLVRIMRAFDLFAGAAGYNTCCEVMQTGVPALFVPNRQVIDDQRGRAELAARYLPAVVSPCETVAQRADAVARVVAVAAAREPREPIELNGAQYAAEEILGLIQARALSSVPSPAAAGGTQ